jgi:hypothetical protein
MTTEGNRAPPVAYAFFLGTITVRGSITVKRLVPVIILLLSGCQMTESSSDPSTATSSTQSGGGGGSGGDGGSGAPPTSSPQGATVNPAGIWNVSGSVTGNQVSEVAMIANGMYFAVATADEFGCADLTAGTYTVDGSTFLGSGVATLQGSCTGQSGNFAWTLNGYQTGANLNLAFEAASALIPTLGASPNPLYSEASSLTKLTGNWNDGPNTLTINPDGTFTEQQASGCVINGAYTILDATHNLYGVSFSISNCTSSLVGIAFTGLGYLDDSTPTAVHFLQDAQGSAGGGATVVVTDNITPQ